MELRLPRRASVLVAVPAKDECERIAACLRALALQQGSELDGIVLVVNNTTDGTAALVRDLQPVLPVPICIIEHWSPQGQASAGTARRLGMDHAASLLGEAGVLLTTDADGRVPPDWVAANLWHLRAGVEAVAGRAVIDPVEAALIPDRLHADDAEECAYATVLDEITALLDPEPWDPLPRHCEHSGASIAVKIAAYRRAGGMPAAAIGEDRHFFDALRRSDARIRHAADIAVVVSGRITGRAPGGMADTIRRRLTAPDPFLDDALEPARAHVLRMRLRHAFRRAHGCAPGEAALNELARALALPLRIVEAACAGRRFGEAWVNLQTAIPSLAARKRVPVVDLPAEMAEAERLRDALRSAEIAECRRLRLEA